jgi:hypothetical protein
MVSIQPSASNILAEHMSQVGETQAPLNVLGMKDDGEESGDEEPDEEFEITLECATEAVADSVPNQTDEQTYDDAETEVIRRFLLLAAKASRRRHTERATSKQEIVRRCYVQCYEIVERSISHRPYKHIFLGPLPHLLVGLDSISQAISKLEFATRSRLETGKHTELEVLEQEMSNIV